MSIFFGLCHTGKYVTARKAVSYLLAAKSSWHGWGSLCQFVPGTSFWSARFVQFGYFTVDNIIFDSGFLYSWLPHGGSLRDPTILVRKPGYFVIRCCQTQARCLRIAPRCRRVGKSDNLQCHEQRWAVLCCHGPWYKHISQARPYLIITGPNTQMSRSFIADLRPVLILSRTKGVPFIRLIPRGHQHPAELHHSGTMMPRHTTGNARRHEKPQISGDQYR